MNPRTIYSDENPTDDIGTIYVETRRMLIFSICYLQVYAFRFNSIFYRNIRDNMIREAPPQYAGAPPKIGEISPQGQPGVRNTRSALRDTQRAGKATKDCNPRFSPEGFWDAAGQVNATSGACIRLRLLLLEALRDAGHDVKGSSHPGFYAGVAIGRTNKNKAELDKAGRADML